MKKTFLLVMMVIVSVVLLVSATVWEGVTDVISTGDLPGGSFSIATNSFPRNTIVDITNLENGKMVRVKVVSGLETTGLLATLSRNAADSIDLRDNSTCRIRMTQPSDDIAFAHYRLGPIIPPAPPVSELDTPVEDGISGADAPLKGDSSVAENVSKTTDSLMTNNAVRADNISANAVPAGNVPAVGASTAAAGNATAALDSGITERTVTAAVNPPEMSIASGKLSMLPAEERPPEDTKRFVITSENREDPPLAPSAQTAAKIPDAAYLPSEFSPFPAPMISSLEPDKWYVQVGVYTQPDHVEDEINRIGTAYPLAIQNVGTDTSPMFRVLLGPLNQGESGAMLQRFKSIGYSDAFVRQR